MAADIGVRRRMVRVERGPGKSRGDGPAGRGIPGRSYRMTVQTAGRRMRRGVEIQDRIGSSRKEDTAARALEGLLGSDKHISSEFFYDRHGSRIFEEITRLPEYYLNRTEKELIAEAGIRFADGLCGADIVELGSGDSSKISIFLGRASRGARASARYLPVDIDRSAIERSARDLKQNYPELRIYGIAADFSGGLEALPPPERRRVFCFFGSTLGNLLRPAALELVRRIAGSMREGDEFLLGLDMVKEKSILERAYNDGAGVTRRFNRNILKVVNALAGTGFDPAKFRHLAFYNKREARIEMYLEAREQMTVSTPLLKDDIIIREEERIHTENSHKFTKRHIEEISSYAGLDIAGIFTDKRKWFSLLWLKKKALK
ncbi:MAG: L-histidine N(alpha)-methyltransferase [Candidatus Omnitrophica bacterium]|nr:L-histidine N(alpha)-methyltransferase [Candidatus Omnitrophota bacterium]